MNERMDATMRIETIGVKEAAVGQYLHGSNQKKKKEEQRGDG